MANKHVTYIDNEPYTLTQLAKRFNISYTTIRRWYKKGYRNEQLLQKSLKSKRPIVKIGNKEFNNRLDASKALGVSKSTFYRQSQKGTLNLILNNDGFAPNKILIVK